MNFTDFIEKIREIETDIKNTVEDLKVLTEKYTQKYFNFWYKIAEGQEIVDGEDLYLYTVTEEWSVREKLLFNSYVTLDNHPEPKRVFLKIITRGNRYTVVFWEKIEVKRNYRENLEFILTVHRNSCIMEFLLEWFKRKYEKLVKIKQELTKIVKEFDEAVKIYERLLTAGW